MSALAALGFGTELAARLPPGRVLTDEPLAGRTTLKVGGPAAALVRAEEIADLVAVAEIASSAGAPVLVLGRGSNLLIADAGWAGIVVTLGRGFRGVTPETANPPDQIRHDGGSGPVVGQIRHGGGSGPGGVGEQRVGVGVVAGAAEPMPVLANALEALGLGGFAFGVAIPGSLGGAVRMNAGAHGREIADVLDWAEVVRLDEGGRVERIAAADLDLAYRHSALPAGAVVVRARLLLAPAERSQLAADMGEMRAWRRAHQPINEPSCGSVFRNPPGDSAGRLIDAAGLKGLRIGGAQVSPVHANFITVSPGATAADVHAVIRAVQQRVRDHAGVDLQTEVVLVGFEDAP